jgi:adenylyl- and sulfurtransferase ThiI
MRLAIKSFGELHSHTSNRLQFTDILVSVIKDKRGRQNIKTNNGYSKRSTVYNKYNVLINIIQSQTVGAENA